MHKLLRSRHLGSWAALAIGLYGFYLGCRQMMGATLQAVVSPVRFDVAHFRQTAYFDFVLYVIGFALFGLLVGLIMTAIQAALDLARDRQALEAERWDRLLKQLEGMVAGRPGDVGGDSGPGRGEAIDAIRRSIRDRDWNEAARLLDALGDEEPSHPALDRLRRDVETGRTAAIESGMERIRASREVNDPDRVFELYDEVGPLLDWPDRKALDDDLARWFMGQVQRRLRSGTIQPDVVALVARVCEVFEGTVEGASLRAGLPTLRRSVGLCPRCAGPYVGVGDACPSCLGVPTPSESS